EIVERFFWVRSGSAALVGFDAAAAIRAGLSVGSIARAREIADAAVRASHRWSEGPTDAQGFRTISRGAFLEALALLDAERYAQAGRDLMHHLLLSQAFDGSWGAHGTQVTALATRGLARWGDEAARSASERGRRWLADTQLTDGAWA